MLFIFQELVMDIMRVLSAPDLEVRKKTLNIALDLVTSRTVEEVSIWALISRKYAECQWLIQRGSGGSLEPLLCTLLLNIL